MIDFFRHCLMTEDGKVIYLLALISITMMIDFLTGMWCAKINKQFESNKGINGILRKISSMLLMIIFVPFSVIIPNGVGLGLVFVMYVGYEIMEIKSILENLNKMGVDINPFINFLDDFEHEIKKGDE